MGFQAGLANLDRTKSASLLLILVKLSRKMEGDESD